MIYKLFRHPERPFVLHFCVGYDSSFMADKINKRKKKSLALGSKYFELDENDLLATFDLEESVPGHFVIMARNLKFTNGDLAHEAFHCAAIHFRYIGVSLDESSEESYAYMVGWIVTSIGTFLHKKNLKLSDV